MNTTNSQIRKRHGKQQAQQGMVLVIVLMIIMLTTATATFALQGSAVEVQAAGSAKRSMVVRGVAESMVMAGASLLDAITVMGTTTAAVQATPNLSYAGIGTLGVNVVGLPQQLFDNASLTPAVLTEAQQRDDIGAVASGDPTSATLPNYQIVREIWPRTDPSAGTVGLQSRIVWIAIASSAPAADVTTPGETRSWHQLVSITQAYYDTNP